MSGFPVGRHVIVGGLGHVGRALRRELQKTGKVVHVLDRVTVQDDSRLYSRHALGRDDPSALATLVEGADCVYSVVTPDVQHSTRREFEQTNHVGIQRLLQACQQAGVPKLVYASSIAVTNHLIPSIQATEQDPLPSYDSYQTHYDLTKRLAEDAVLDANQTELKTCALRLGGILAGPNDYNVRNHFEHGKASQTIYTFIGQKIDTIAVDDVATALALASNALESSLPGKAVYCTKANHETLGIHKVAMKLAQHLNWKLQVLPPAVLYGLRAKEWLVYQWAKRTTPKDDLPGMPPHVYLDIPNHEKTFDNSLAHQLLNWKPKVSWDDVLKQTAQEYLQQNPTTTT